MAECFQGKVFCKQKPSLKTATGQQQNVKNAPCDFLEPKVTSSICSSVQLPVLQSARLLSEITMKSIYKPGTNKDFAPLS